MGFWLRWFGILLGAISLFSLANKIWNFGLSPIFRDMLAFYRAALHPLAQLLASGLQKLFSIVGLTIPHIPADLVVMYILLGAAFFRFTLTQYATMVQLYRGDDEGSDVPTRFDLIYVILFSTIWPVMLIAALPLYFTDKRKMKELREEFGEKDDLSEFWAPTIPLVRRAGVTLRLDLWFLEILKVIFAFIILFTTNAYFTY